MWQSNPTISVYRTRAICQCCGLVVPVHQLDVKDLAQVQRRGRPIREHVVREVGWVVPQLCVPVNAHVPRGRTDTGDMLRHDIKVPNGAGSKNWGAEPVGVSFGGLGLGMREWRASRASRRRAGGMRMAALGGWRAVRPTRQSE